MLGQTDANRFFPVVETQKGPSMRYVDSIFGSLLKPIDRRRFQGIVDRHDGDAYDKSFKSWDHLVALVYAQWSNVDSLRGLQLAFDANAQAHYHLGVKSFARSTLADANTRRPPQVFAETFAMLAVQADRQTRREGAAMVRLIDASPIPLGKLCHWAEWNGRIRGMKLHVVHDPQANVPHCVEITPANVNDVEVGKGTPIEAGTTYVFDKGYCHFGWWRKINDHGAFFVTRAKTNMRLRAVSWRSRSPIEGDGCTILDDAEVVHKSKGNVRLAIPLRRIRIKRDKGGTITLITNDLERPAVAIAALYKSRWQIELLFRWIKQHLRIRKFLGRNENAIRLQILAAMIAYLLQRLAAHLHRVTLPAQRLTELICQRLFMRNPIANISKPPQSNPSRRNLNASPDQLEFCYA
jgi:putative transposase